MRPPIQLTSSPVLAPVFVPMQQAIKPEKLRSCPLKTYTLGDKTGEVRAIDPTGHVASR